MIAKSVPMIKPNIMATIVIIKVLGTPFNTSKIVYKINDIFILLILDMVFLFYYELQ